MAFLPQWIRLILAIFSCYRLAGFLAYDEGPGSVFLKLRRWAGAYDLGQNGEPRRALGRFIRCPYCTGVWLAIVCGAGFIWPTMIGDMVLTWLGIAGAQTFVEVKNNGER